MKPTKTLLVTCLAATILWCAAAPAGPSQPELDNVTAFARLYGVVRYFYPGDRAAALDWNRFAVYGVQRTRTARDTHQLELTLQRLFQPLGPGLVINTKLPPAAHPESAEGPLVAWRYLGIPFGWPNANAIFGAKRTHRPTIRGAVMLRQTIPATSLRGKTIRLRGMVRTKLLDGTGIASLSLEIFRGPHRSVFFDSKHIRTAGWREYSMEGAVDRDATEVTVQALVSGAVMADFDALKLDVQNSPGQWTPVPLQDGGFEAPEESKSGAWTRIMFRPGQARFSRPAGGAPEGRRFLRIAPNPANADAELFKGAAPKPGAHIDLDPGQGLRARVPLTLTDEEARAGVERSSLSQSALPSLPGAQDKLSLDVRWADIVVAWNAFRHFYPYWPESGVNWDKRLRPHLVDDYRATTRSAHEDSLRRLVADARDDHGRVIDPTFESWNCPACPLKRKGQAVLPVQFGLVENRVAITASAHPDVAPVGAEVLSIQGQRVAKKLTAAEDLISGSPQWKSVRALQRIATCAKGTSVQLMLDSGTGTHPVELPCDSAHPPEEKRPGPAAELSPGVWYVDLTRARMSEVSPLLPKLAQAPAVIFDMRGYPTDAGDGILPHLLRKAEKDSWMHTAEITGPFGQVAGWDSGGYDLKPAEPHLSGKIVFLTDARAVSAGDGVMSYVADRKLGTILGSTTAGTDGNVVTFSVPGGFNVSFTGFRVTRHDGVTPFHLRGVQPDIAVAPTLAGLRQGRDEVLERALALAGGTDIDF